MNILSKTTKKINILAIILFVAILAYATFTAASMPRISKRVVPDLVIMKLQPASLDEALDMSLRYGLDAVNWDYEAMLRESEVLPAEA